MPSQSGKVVLVLVLFLLLIGVVAYFFLQNYKSNNQLGPQSNLPTDSNPMLTDLYSQKQGKNLEGLNIKTELPDKSDLEEFQADAFGTLKGAQPQKAYKFYFNEDSNIAGVDKEYSGLTLFFILYPNKDNLLLKEFLPKIGKSEENSIDTIEDVRIGSVVGFKHTQCCNSGGVVEYYFLNENTSDLILIKAYNYGPNHELYSKKLEDIIKSIKFN